MPLLERPKEMPLVFKFDEEGEEAIFGKHKPALVLFKNTDQPDLMKIYEEAAEQLKYRIKFTFADVNGGELEQLLAKEIIGVTENEMPSLWALFPAKRNRSVRFNVEECKIYKSEADLK